MKQVSAHENPIQALDQFEHLAHESQSGLGRGLARIAMLLAAGRYCRHRHLSIGRQSTFQRKLMDQESHHEY
ncbi:hypothetical protein GCM10011352_28350 [Marinobacterium zhoushanense]|uniref:Uncharacterized protein n=1 Tax=Marinobacterium zhoushanense TaxID=1679163 RepID=A0ABQ1KI65_9GAMM|nr:hypothetical protein [Marinobacterium zhoushanense]GGC00533.1 hypothetical protein GCM10011352_28350 [Marinobacterium zhoushanense]